MSHVIKKPGIPPAPKPGDNRARFDQAVKESIETIMARRGPVIQLLEPTTATAEDCANKINEILLRVQG